MSQKQIITYTSWEPACSAADVFRSGVNFSFLAGDSSGRLFWVESRPHEQGRCVVVMRDKDGKVDDLLPAPYSARSRVMEYGGMPYVAAADRVVFVNFSDQRLYEVNLRNVAAVRPLTPAKSSAGHLLKYMQPDISPDGRWLVAACEVEGASHEPENAICLLDLAAADIAQPKIIVSGADFYRKPVFSPDGKSIAWLQWNHPDMPWDSSLLQLAPFADGQIDKDAIVNIAGSRIACVNDFAFAADSRLFYVLDYKGAAPDSVDNFFNLYCSFNGRIERITNERRDFFQLFVCGESVVALVFDHGIPGLATIDAASGKTETIKTPFVSVSLPVLAGSRMATVGVFNDRPACLAFLAPEGSISLIRESAPADIAVADISAAEAIQFPTADGQTCYGYFYPPKNSRYQAPQGDLPPVRVLVHGGPTAMTRPGFSRQNAFWTSQGYAVFDVNYRGSFGYGRAYRDALLGQWGVLDIADVRDGLEWLKKQKKIGDIAVVSGGSAGGYTVQRLLTEFPGMFAAGASYFGIGNLVTLQKLTHKFESRYLEGLLGGSLADNPKVFAERSPINHLDKLESPMIIFQGSEDKVVPPENSREMAEILAQKQIRHEYHEYPGEAHGFRLEANLTDSLRREAAFFREVIVATKDR